jgi:heme oxygenase
LKTSETIRQALRDATAGAHARLDAAMARLDLSRANDYAVFLGVQLEARHPIEEWAALHCPFELRPPQQTALILADLAEVGDGAITLSPARFSALSEGALGVAWALGGSSLGNRAMLAGLRKRKAAMSVRFLADGAMPTFFARLRRQLEQPADGYHGLAPAIAAAQAVFATFVSVAGGAQMKRAA